MSAHEPCIYEFGEFRLDPRKCLLLSRTDERRIALTPRVFDTLAYFVEHCGELVEKATLMKAVWPNVVVEENNLNQSISALRRALGEAPRERRFIVTVPGRGYRFVAEVTRHVWPRGAPMHGRSVFEPSTLTGVGSHAAPGHASIAVLPFANLTGDADKEYIGDGMTEELIHVLTTRLPGLKVPARTSSFAYKGKNIHIRDIARDLAVAMILEGSVRSAGDRLRVTAQLVDAQTGYHVWSQTYERAFGDVFKLQDELASAVAHALKLDAGGASPVAPTPIPPTHDVEAYQLYLQSQVLAYRPSDHNLRTARRLLQQAIARDPKFSRALVGMASADMVGIAYGYSPPEMLKSVQRAAQQALALDPSLAQGHSVLGWMHAARGNWLDAEDHFQKAIALDHLDPLIRITYVSQVAHCVGHLSKALEQIRYAYRLAPAWPCGVMNLAFCNMVLGLDAEAHRYLDLTVDLGHPKETTPIPEMYSVLAARAGRYAEAADLMVAGLSDEVRAANGEDVVRLVHSALEDPTKAGTALAALRALQAGLSLNTVEAKRVVLWYVMLGAVDAAYEAVNQVLDDFARLGTVGTAWGFLWLPEMREFRRDARFQAFATRLGLMEYWKQYGPPDDCELRDGKLSCH